MTVKFGLETYEETEVTNLQSFPNFSKMLANAQKILRSEEALKDAGDALSEASAREGPSVKKDCQYCGNDRMTYVTMQTRSADEGQTVIYTCTQCKKKEVENTWLIHFVLVFIYINYWICSVGASLIY